MTLGELLKGIDALLSVKSNPTSFQHFEVRYTTRGELQLTAFGGSSGIRYAVQAGRVTTAQAFLNEEQFRKLRGLFESASQLLAAGASKN